MVNILTDKTIMHKGRLSGLACNDFIIKNGNGIIVSCAENTKEEFKGEYHLVVYEAEHVGKSVNRFKTIDDLPKFFRDFLFNEHGHNDETGEIVYSEESVLKLLNIVL